MTEEEFQEFVAFCNGLDRGFVKTWKAGSIIRSLEQIPAILSDRARLRAYIDNSLKMEGFSDDGCAKIVTYLENKMISNSA